MPIPAAVKHAADLVLIAYCERRVPVYASIKVHLVRRWRGLAVTLVEQRAWWNHDGAWVDGPIAQFRYNLGQNTWSLHWRDRSQRWHPCEGVDESTEITRLLAEVDHDPTGIFWG